MVEMHRNVRKELLPALYHLKMDFQYVGDALLLLRNVLINTTIKTRFQKF